MTDVEDRSARRLSVMVEHAERTLLGVLLAVAVVRAWQTGEHPAASTILAVAFVGCYLLSRRHRAWLVGVVVLWALGNYLSSGFAWVLFPLFFVVLGALPWWPALVVVAVLTAWSCHLSGFVLGPVVAALSAVLAFVLFTQQRRDAERHRALVAELREAQDSLAATEHERGVLAERERLAREIHDTIGQGLASIVVLARTARTSPDGGAEQLALIESTAREDLAEARRLIRDLGAHPGEVGLVDALRALTSDTAARAAATGRPVDVGLRLDGTPREPAPEVVAALRRGVQASLANVVQHAQASRCAVGVAWFDDEVVVDVVDDGAGFDPALVGPGSYGLRALDARLREVGGSLSVDSAPGEGTTIALTAPLPPRSRGGSQAQPRVPQLTPSRTEPQEAS